MSMNSKDLVVKPSNPHTPTFKVSKLYSHCQQPTVCQDPLPPPSRPPTLLTRFLATVANGNIPLAFLGQSTNDTSISQVTVDTVDTWSSESANCSPAKKMATSSMRPVVSRSRLEEGAQGARQWCFGWHCVRRGGPLCRRAPSPSVPAGCWKNPPGRDIVCRRDGKEKK